MKNTFQFILLTALIALVGCGQSPKPSKPSVANTPPPATAPSGEKLWERNCTTCHGPGSLSAPQMTEMATAYDAKTSSEEDFIKNVVNFIQNPTREDAKMPAAIEKYGLMPKMGVPEKDFKAIAKYIYAQAKAGQSDAAAPSAIRPDGSIDYMVQGKEFALQTKAILSKNLLAAIEQKGTAGAVTFCNTKAYPLTDSMSKALNVKIKRVSDQPRNPKNVASASQLAAIKKQKAALAAGEMAKPSFEETPKKFTGFYPIPTNAMCLQCHGKLDADIQPEVQTKLASLYPKDKATGYGENQLRGIWVVEMEK